MIRNLGYIITIAIKFRAGKSFTVIPGAAGRSSLMDIDEVRETSATPINYQSRWLTGQVCRRPQELYDRISDWYIAGQELYAYEYRFTKTPSPPFSMSMLKI